jgi:DNA protecting protein DprA
VRLIPTHDEVQTRHYQACGEEESLRWLAPPGSGADSPRPPPPHLVQRPPRELFVRGRSAAFELLRWLPEFGFAVVGTRKPQARSVELVRSRLRALEGTRLIILSGLALGIDTAAHEAALRSGLPTIAVLGGSLDDVYPRENRALASRIIERGGLLVSEFPAGTQIERHFFLLRNRLIAGWAKATWIVEAGARSGALNTAKWAFDQNRDTYATPCFPGDPAHAGNQGLIHRDKAHAFWEPDNLGQTWKEFGSLGHRSRIHPQPSLWGSRRYARAHYNDGGEDSDASHLSRVVIRATVESGGASVQFLLDWALAREWNPQRFFDALQTCLNEKRIEDHGGILCSLRPVGSRQ